MAFMDSGWRLRFEPEIVRRVRRRLRCGLLTRQPVGLTERSVQFFSVRVVRDEGHGKEDIRVEEKWPLIWRRESCGGQLIVGTWYCDCASVMLVDRGRRRVVSLVRLLIALARLGKGRGSPTRDRSRCRRLWHFARAARALTLLSSISSV